MTETAKPLGVVVSLTKAIETQTQKRLIRTLIDTFYFLLDDILRDPVTHPKDHCPDWLMREHTQMLIKLEHSKICLDDMDEHFVESLVRALSKLLDARDGITSAERRR